MPLVVTTEVSSHFAIVEEMQEALPLPAQSAGSIVHLPAVDCRYVGGCHVWH